MASSSQQLALALAWMFAVPTLVLLAGFAPVGRGRLARFASPRDLTVTVTSGPVLITYLARVSRWRAVGGAAGWVAGGALALPGAYYFWGAAGYLVGALAAEIRTSVRLTPPDGPRRASLAVRRSGDYLSWGVRWGPVFVISAVALQLAGYLRWPSAGTLDVQPSEVLLGGTGVAVVTAVLWLSRWLIVRRPRPVLPDDLNAVDDEIRASSLQTIGGASLALMCLAAGDVMWDVTLDLDAPEPFNWIHSVLAFGVFAMALYAWFGVRVRARRLLRETTE
ncbi:hypothetical protein GCM10010156_72520 [Planobispora rosea]|uniref:Uncharacterized protein n=1 Tax=Planobispora rosea TaxID=35762 RepID=A0A8J3SFN5_PLARO|nr:hypothetical protein [Planobispora rosea]GGT04197.1 hypothetical protein GCM10010156_72520 [Planobispora rosea]GIH88828.1 hypothetical protein Pro02_72360 [Planobispora rosea]